MALLAKLARFCKAVVIGNPLPYRSLHDDNRSLCGTGDRLERWYLIDGIDPCVCSPEEQARFLDMRRHAYDAAHAHQVAFDIHTFKTPIVATVSTKSYDNPVAKMLVDAAATTDLFEIRNVIVLSARGPTAGPYLDRVESEIQHYFKGRGFRPLRHDEPDVTLRPRSLIRYMVSPLLPLAGGEATNPVEGLDPINRRFHRDHLTIYSHHRSPHEPAELFESLITIQREGSKVREDFSLGLSAIPANMIISHLARPRGPHQSADQSDATALWDYSVIIAVRATTIAELNKAREVIDSVILRSDASPIRPKVEAAVNGFYSRFGSTRRLSSPALFDSYQLARAASSLGIDTGMPNSDWGAGPLFVFPTVARTPYQFIWQSDDLQWGRASGHTVIIGGPGSGKTTTLGLLTAASTRYNNHANLLIDANGGLKNLTLALGGSYFDLAKSGGVGFNPGDYNTTAAKDAISFMMTALEINNGQRDGDLERVFDVDPQSQLGRVLYAPGEASAGSVNPLLGIDIASLIDDPDLAEIAVPYFIGAYARIIQHRGSTATIALDEASHVLALPPMKARYQYGMAADRHLGINWVTCFQNPEQIIDIGMMERMLDSVSNFIIFPKEGADRAPYKSLGLSNELIDFVVSGGWGNPHLACIWKRSLSRAPHSVIVDIGLKHIGTQLLNLLSADSNTRRLLEEIRENYPDVALNQIALAATGPRFERTD